MSVTDLVEVVGALQHQRGLIDEREQVLGHGALPALVHGREAALALLTQRRRQPRVREQCLVGAALDACPTAWAVRGLLLGCRMSSEKVSVGVSEKDWIEAMDARGWWGDGC